MSTSGRKSKPIPVLVKTAIDDGYEVVHAGALFLTEIRTCINPVQRRLWSLFLEMKFTYTFWTLDSRCRSSWIYLALAFSLYDTGLLLAVVRQTGVYQRLLITL